MSRKELNEKAKRNYTWKQIFTALGFREKELEPNSDGSPCVEYSRETSSATVIFVVTTEEKPAYLTAFVESDRALWEKLDVITTFHTGSVWWLEDEIASASDGLLSGPLAEIAHETRMKDLQGELDVPLEDRLSFDPQFRKAYERAFRELSAKKAAEEYLNGVANKQLGDLSKMTYSEIKERIGWIDWLMLWADETPERWFIPNLLCEGRGHGCPAPSGIGKSLLWQEVGAGLSAGRSVLGFPAQEPIRVLYLDHENTPKGDIKPRLIAMGYTPADLANFFYLSFPSIESLNTKLGGQSLCQLLDYFKPQLVFIDTFSRFVEGDENSSKVAQDFYEYAGRELKKRNIAYLRIDHVGKDASKGARGSSAKVDDLDLIWVMSKTKEPNVFLLKNEKARVPVTSTELLIERTFSPLKHTVKSGIDWKALLASAVRHEKAVSLVEDLMARDPKHSLAQGKVWKDLGPLCKSAGISRSELFDALREVKGEDLQIDEAS